MTELTDLSETDDSNVTITGTNINEGCSPSGINNAIRSTLGLIRRAFKSSIFRLRDSTDQTKLLALDLSGLTTATTRTLKAPDKSGTIALNVTDWVEYTPTFTGFGTPTNVNIHSRRVGDTLEIMGRFTAGSTAATTAIMTLGFDGVDGGITIDSSKVFSSQLVGVVTVSAAGPVSLYCLGTAGASAINFGIQSATRTGADAVTAAALASSGNTVSLQAKLPIAGW